MKLLVCLFVLCLFARGAFAAGAEDFVPLCDAVPGAVQEPRYASSYNFMGVRVDGYDIPSLSLCHQAAEALAKAEARFEARGLRLKIWDAYRPVAVQQALHDSAPAELSPYVPAPGPWSMHARGITLDVTLCYPDGTNLDMPTDFDDFSTRANSDYADVTEAQAEPTAETAEPPAPSEAAPQTEPPQEEKKEE